MSPHRNVDPGEETLEERVQRLEEELLVLREREALRPRALVERLVPPEVRSHLRAAQRERLLAVRAWIDAAIKHTEEQPERPRRRESVRIE
jgi:hypothetical protein